MGKDASSLISAKADFLRKMPGYKDYTVTQLNDLAAEEVVADGMELVLSDVHIDEIVEVSEENNPYYTEQDGHGWLDENGWLHRNAYVINAVNGNVYNLTVDIAKARDGRTIFYATKGKIKRVGQTQVDSIPKDGPWSHSDSDKSIAQDTSSVNRKYSISEENVSENAENPDVSENRDMTDRELLHQRFLLLIIVHRILLRCLIKGRQATFYS